MSHQDLAALWSTLHCRADIDNILQELIGRYFLDVSEHTSDRALFRATAFSHVVALRTIFDLQRTYLQSLHLSFESKTSLLNPDILFSAIKHILGVKISAFCAHDGLPDHDAYCSFIGQALVSGVRALHLQKRRLSLAEYEAVIEKFRQAWSNETLRDVDHFSINLFCQRMLAELSNNEHNHGLSTPACGVIRLQDFYYGLVSLSPAAKSANSDHLSTPWTTTLMLSYLPPRPPLKLRGARLTGFTVLWCCMTSLGPRLQRWSKCAWTINIIKASMTAASLGILLY